MDGTQKVVDFEKLLSAASICRGANTFKFQDALTFFLKQAFPGSDASISHIAYSSKDDFDRTTVLRYFLDVAPKSIVEKAYNSMLRCLQIPVEEHRSLSIPLSKHKLLFLRCSQIIPEEDMAYLDTNRVQLWEDRELMSCAVVYLDFLPTKRSIKTEQLVKNHPFFNNNAALCKQLLLRKSDKGRVLKFASERLRDNEEIVMMALAQDPGNLLYTSRRFRDREDLALAGVTHNVRVLSVLSDRLRSNRDIAFAAVRHDPEAIRYAPDIWKDDEDFVLLAVKRAGITLAYASLRMRDNENIVLAAIESQPKALQYASNRIRDHLFSAPNRFHDREDLALAVVTQNGKMLRLLTDRLRSNKDIVSAAVRNYAYALQYASDTLKDDKDVVLIAVRRNGETLRLASPRLRDQKSVVLAAIDTTSYAFGYASNRLRDSEDVALAAIELDGRELRHASDRLRDSERVVTAAVEQNGFFIEFASQRIKNDRDFVLFAIQYITEDESGESWAFLPHLPERLSDDFEIVIKVIQKNPLDLQFASNRLRSDAAVIRTVIKIDGYGIMFASEALRDDKQLVLDALRTEKNETDEYDDILQNMSARLRDDPDVVSETIRLDRKNIRFASERLKDDETFMLSEISKHFDEWRIFYDTATKRIRPLLAAGINALSGRNVI